MGKAVVDDGLDSESVGRFRGSIAGQITSRSLLLAVVPVAILGALTVGGLFLLSDRMERGLGEARQELAEETIGAERAEQSRLVLARTEAFVVERVDDVIDWSRSPMVVDAAAEDRPDMDRFATRPAELVELDFDGSDLLDESGRSSRFLQDQISDRPSFAEVFFTDANGFNVGATNPTSDFVQRDEEWWQEAFADGAFVGPLEFDESASVFSFEVAIRIETRFGQPVGVVKAVIDASALQTFADEFADGDATGTEVRVLTADGLLLAETASDHDPSRIGEIVNFDNDQQTAFEAALGGGSSEETVSGFLLLNDAVAGFSSTPPSRTIDRLGLVVGGEQWVAIVEQPVAQALAPLDGMETLQADLRSSAGVFSAVVVALTLLAIAGAVLVSRIVSRRIVRPINELRLEAHRVADDELPTLVETLRSSAQRSELPVVEPIEIEAQQSEVFELASALNSVRSMAVHLAATQAIGRTRDVASVLVSLGRRNQQLAGRLLRFVDDREQSESDPNTLRDLFQIDQLATRMRRNAESLLVLAGEESHQTATDPMSVDDVIRSAISAVEDFGRVEVAETAQAFISPLVARDLSHLLAELIENATAFSSPETTVEIVGSFGLDDRYTISIVDNGIGMSREQLTEANRSLREPRQAEDGSTTKLGFMVVGRLAQRHGIDSRLVESAAQGLTAKVTLPTSCLVPAVGEQRPSLPVSALARSVEGPAALTAAPRQPKAALPTNRTGLTVADEPISTESPWPPPTAQPLRADHDLIPAEPLAPARRRSRRPPATADPTIEYSSSDALDKTTSPTIEYSSRDGLDETTSAEQSRAEQVRQDLTRYTIGVEAATAHPPTNDEDRIGP